MVIMRKIMLVVVMVIVIMIVIAIVIIIIIIIITRDPSCKLHEAQPFVQCPTRQDTGLSGTAQQDCDSRRTPT